MTIIKTLDEILADMDESTSAKVSETPKPKLPQNAPLKHPQDTVLASIHRACTSHPKSSTDVSEGVFACRPSGLSGISSTSVALGEILQHTPIEPLTQNDKKTNYLRWLAFYYLSCREHSQKELRQKLLAKGCDPKAVETLLQEFAKKDYQSDLRTALMVVREAVRLGKGRRYIEQKFWRLGLDLPYCLDELVEMAGESLTDGTVLECERATVDWLLLAVSARTKKYGVALPKTPKEKARQLRFLQYRGFAMDVCLQALSTSLSDLVANDD